MFPVQQLLVLSWYGFLSLNHFHSLTMPNPTGLPSLCSSHQPPSLKQIGSSPSQAFKRLFPLPSVPFQRTKAWIFASRLLQIHASYDMDKVMKKVTESMLGLKVKVTVRNRGRERVKPSPSKSSSAENEGSCVREPVNGGFQTKHSKQGHGGRADWSPGFSHW